METKIKNNTQKKIIKIPWLKPFLILTILSLLLFGINRIIDHLFIYIGFGFFNNLFTSDLGNLTNTLGGLAEVVTAVIGVEITAVAIIVQLAANRYSSKIMELFISDRINFIVVAIYVVTAINAVLVTNTIKENLVPFFSIAVTLFLIALSLLIVIPHFYYVFNFLRPQNFLSYVNKRAIQSIELITKGKVKSINVIKDQINGHINFCGDVAIHSVHQVDRAVTLLCLNSIREIAQNYIEHKKAFPEYWFKATGAEHLDPDFSNYSTFVMEKIEERKTFLERKIFRLYEMVFGNSRANLHDVAGGVLLNTELIAYSAIESRDLGTLQTILKYFNSFLRMSITGKDPRSAYNTLEHYRNVAEKLLDFYPHLVVDISLYFRNYGQEAVKHDVFFILETAAYDLCRINEIAFDKNVINKEELLNTFLTLGKNIQDKDDMKIASREVSLIGVRIAQTRLAAFYLLRGNESFARIIYEDMKFDPPNRISKIKETIFNTTGEEFWEVTPRGVNFYYMNDDRKNALNIFFGWFE